MSEDGAFYRRGIEAKVQQKSLQRPHGLTTGPDGLLVRFWGRTPVHVTKPQPYSFAPMRLIVSWGSSGSGHGHRKCW